MCTYMCIFHASYRLDILFCQGDWHPPAAGQVPQLEKMLSDVEVPMILLDVWHPMFRAWICPSHRPLKPHGRWSPRCSLDFGHFLTCTFHAKFMEHFSRTRTRNCRSSWRRRSPNSVGQKISGVSLISHFWTTPLFSSHCCWFAT